MSKKDNVNFIDNNTAYLKDHQLIIAMGEPLATPSVEPTPVEVGGNSATMGFWGEDNLYPQSVIEEAEKDTELAPLLDWKGRVLQGREVIALDKVWSEEKKDFDFVRINDEEINGFLSDIIFKRYWREACVDFTWFQNIFPDMIKSKDGNKIASLTTHDASWCRWGVMDKSGNITKCFVSAQWADGAKPDDKTKTMEHAVIDPYSPEAVELLKANKKLIRFVYPANYPSPGRAYYSVAAWASFLFSKWYSIKKNIPIWKEKHMTQVLSANFILTIPHNYWRVANKDWDKLNAGQQLTIKKNKAKEINDQLTGQAGVGKTILSEVGIDENGKEVPMFKIEAITGGLKDGQYTEDSQEASGHLNRALNVDSTLVGSGPGRGKDAGSGSDKRVAFNIYTAILTPYREVLLEPLYFIAKYNDWLKRFPNLHFKVLEVEIQTLDQGATSSVKNPVTDPNPA